MDAPTRSEIIQAQSKAVGGGRKRCRRGKNCSAACIAGGDTCLVDLSPNVGVATTKVRDLVASKTSRKPGLAARGNEALKELRSSSTPVAATKTVTPTKNKPSLASLADNLLKDLRGNNTPKVPTKTPAATPTSTPSVQSGGTSAWQSRFADSKYNYIPLRTELSNLKGQIDKLPPEERAQWNKWVDKGLTFTKAKHVDGSPYTPTEINLALTSQAKGWNSMIKEGPPKQLQDRVGEKRPAPKGMIPDVSSSGQRKWISPEDGLKYSGGTKEGTWRQNRVSKLDTMRRLPAISDFRTQQQMSKGQWPTQSLPPREDLKGVTRAQIIAQLSEKDKKAIVFNGLNATGQEGLVLRNYYNANPKEKEARLNEIVDRYLAQGGRSGVSGLPIALPGLEPKKGEERTSVDHFRPISTDRKNKELTAEDIRRVADNGKNFLITEEGPNSQRGAKEWDVWLDRVSKS